MRAAENLGRLNAAFVGVVFVLGPVIANATFGRRYWGLVLAALILGTVGGGLLALRVHPRYPLRFAMGCTCVLASLPLVLGLRPMFGLLAAAAAALTGLGGAVRGRLVGDHAAPDPGRPAGPGLLLRHARLVRRIPVGEIAVGPLSSVFGLRTTLVGAGVVILLAMLAALASRSVRDLTND